jgi:prepilin-type N-terminal cleavage/methylation domain-containing protein
MGREMRKGARGVTLVELMVAVVMLAIVVMYISLVPTQSQRQMWKADRVSAATAGARDKVEEFRGVIGKTSPTFQGFDSLRTGYTSGLVYWDTFRFAETRVVRRWSFRWPTGPSGDSGKGTLSLRCIALDGGQLARDSMDTQVSVETWVAKRDTLPPF